MHHNFTLFRRKNPSGKIVIYFYAYDAEGHRLTARSTGRSTKMAARNYCNDLFKKGKLVPGIGEVPTFAEWAADFWDTEKSAYLKDRAKHRKLTQAYIDHAKNHTEKTLVDYFGKMKLDQITGEVIEAFQDYQITKKKRKHTTINGYTGTLQTMIKWAVRKRVIEHDPFLDLSKLLDDAKTRTIITLDEFDKLFNKDWKTVWNNDFLMCTANKLAALTGMRCCEVLGLRGNMFSMIIFSLPDSMTITATGKPRPKFNTIFRLLAR
jgi:integrase